MKDTTPLPWYKDGLRFKSTGCGKCCTGSPGYVWINESEIQALSEFLNITPEEFVRRYTHKLGGRLSLKEDPINFDCVFLKDNRCTVYNDRPQQCRTFPWWKENLKSRQAWEETAMRCEGIGHSDSPLISLEELEKQSKQ